MKKILLFLLLCMSSMVGSAEVNQTTSKGTHCIVITDLLRPKGHLAEPIDRPDVFYNSINSNITVDFGTQSVNSYTVTISSPFADVDYYATSSFVTIPFAVDGVSDYSIVIETSDGDVFEGTLTASEYASGQMY